MSNFIGCIDRYGEVHQISKEKIKENHSVYAIIIKDDMILLSPEDGGYSLPGGSIEWNETEVEALVREVWEETGYESSIWKLIARRQNYFFCKKRGPMDGKLAYYVATIVGGKLSDRNLDSEERNVLRLAEWVSLKKLEAIPILSSVDIRPIIQEIIAQL